MEDVHAHRGKRAQPAMFGTLQDEPNLSAPVGLALMHAGKRALVRSLARAPAAGAAALLDAADVTNGESSRRILLSLIHI